MKPFSRLLIQSYNLYENLNSKTEDLKDRVLLCVTPMCMLPPPPFLFRSHSDYWLTRLRPLLNQHNKTNKQGKHTNKRKKQTNRKANQKNKQTEKRTKKTNKQTKMTKEGKKYTDKLEKRKKKPGITCFIPSLFFLDKSSLVWWDLKNWLSYRLMFVQHTFEIIGRLYKLFFAVYMWEKILNGSKMS